MAYELEHRTADRTTTYTLDELHHLDSLEMLQMPVYTQAPAAGIYKTYKSFRENRPDEVTPLAVEFLPDGRPSPYTYTLTRKGDTTKVYLSKKPGIYAVSDGKHLVKFFQNKCYLLEKTGTGFYFNARASYSTGNSPWIGAVGGLSGAILANAVSNGNAKTFRFRMNPRTGLSVPVALPDQQ